MNNETNQNFSNLLENPKDFDVKIKVGENPNIKEFKVHSIILSARSDYFKAALCSRWAKREDGFIVFDKPNISPLVFEILINYIYTGTFSNNNEVSLLDIFIAADEIGLVEISQQIKKPLKNEVLGYVWQNKFLKAFEFCEEILENIPHSVEGQKSALSWRFPSIRVESEDINELSKILCKETTLTSLDLSNLNIGSRVKAGVKKDE
ncbi:btb/poz domain-containing protein 19-like [Gigaspora margarita]|uniref:Btb/poz domain-containing protein 19-like n=1 Tax=Gigaspora margarita TaxID=4874 RepID=A0A8H4A9N9_GIGMA|nr:btb/poz domain-containing protein 19-like [Gigaspora margarita]